MLRADKPIPPLVEAKPVSQASVSSHALAFGQKSINDLIVAVYDIDLSIEVLAMTLRKFQPNLPGHVSVVFFKNARFLSGDGGFVYDAEPVVGKILPMKSGSWRFFRLGKNDRYEKLSDLRVGKKLKTDARVRKMLDKLEQVLERRADLFRLLSSVRQHGPGKIVSAKLLCEDMLEYCNRINASVSDDDDDAPEYALAA